jgi:hypothetical protein
MSQANIPPLTQPRLTFSTLAKLIGTITVAKQFSLLKGHKYPKPGPKRGYQNAVKQIVDHLVQQSPLTLAVRTLRANEQEILQMLSQNQNLLPRNLQCTRPNPHATPWQIHGVIVSMYPDIELANGHTTGALKLYLAKDPLAHGVGKTMATLLYHYRTQFLNLGNVDPKLCQIVEPRQNVTHYASTKTQQQLVRLQQVCQMVSLLWPGLLINRYTEVL